MISLIARAAFAGTIIALVALIAKRWPTWGGVLAAAPMASILAFSMVWMETRDAGRIVTLSWSTLIFVAATVPFFVVLPVMLGRGFSYWAALGGALVATFAAYGLTFALMRQMGYEF